MHNTMHNRTLSGLIGSWRYLTHSSYLSTKGYLIKRIRAGREFHRILAQLEQSQWYSSDRLRDIQDSTLSALIEHAYENVPYYNRLFKYHGIRPTDIKGVEDLKVIPPISKDTIRANRDDFVASNCNRRFLATGWTTGSTGTPFNVLRTLKSIVFDKAILTRQRRWAGIDVHDRNVAVWATIWSNVIVPRHIESPPYWRFNAADNQMLFSYYHLSDETLPAFIDKLEEFRPAFIEGFPSTLLTLARFLNRQRRVLAVKAVFTTGEPLYTGHRKEIEQSLQTKVFDYYGHAERVVTAAECEHGRMHVNPEYGVLEILQGDDNASIADRGEIVGTGLTNYGMPLIRYRTGDMSRLADDPCPCGRQTPLLEGIDGRIADFIRTPDGRLMPGDGLMEAFYGLGNIKESQIVQEDIDNIAVRIVRDDETAAVDTHRLFSNLQNRLGDGIRISIQFVNSISEGGRVKRRWVVSKLKEAVQ